ncbi:LCP family protein [Streptomyces megasporus]|uniref:LCP family protein n=1 Tax=Streptomyces megasporus TaxID=44060 RepID=UPI00056BA94E|nr:LCP family protein [Streptomyces megasporus]
MNDRQDPYGLGDPPQANDHIHGYDEYGRPVHGDPPRQDHDASYPAPGAGGQPAYDPYAPYPPDGHARGSYDQDPYAQGSHAQDPYPQTSYAQDPYTQISYAQDPYASGTPTPGAYPQDPYASGPYAPDAYAPVPGATEADPTPEHGGYGARERYTASWDGSAAATDAPGSAGDVWIPQQPQAPWYEEGHGAADGARALQDSQGTRDSREGRDGTEPGRPDPDTVPASAGAPSGTERDGTDDADGEYRSEEFSFIEEQNEESEDVIDWLKFSESRTERREEAKRRGRNRTIALIVAVAVVLVGGVGWLWFAGKLPGLSGSEEAEQAAGGGQKRTTIVVHLREVDGGEISTVLLVNNETAGKGTTVLLPNSLAVTSSGGTGGATTLGKVFEAEGAAATRDALGLLLGTDIRGTWRLDTPYLENWVELVGGITVDADTTVPGAKEGEEPLVEKGADRDLDGRAAVAYATHRATGEPQTKQLARFGQVVQATLAKMSSDPGAATETVRSLTQILDPSLTESQLGASLAPLAGYAKKGDYATELLPVEADGTLSEETGEGLVRNVLGGTVRNTDPDAAPRVSLKDATGDEAAATTARVALVNGGYTVVGAGTSDSPQAATRVTYSDEKHKRQAQEVARTLGLSEKAVAKGKGAANADVTVVLGEDYDPEGASG